MMLTTKQYKELLNSILKKINLEGGSIELNKTESKLLSMLICSILEELKGN